MAHITKPNPQGSGCFGGSSSFPKGFPILLLEGRLVYHWVTWVIDNLSTMILLEVSKNVIKVLKMSSTMQCTSSETIFHLHCNQHGHCLQPCISHEIFPFGDTGGYILVRGILRFHGAETSTPNFDHFSTSSFKHNF